MSIKSEPYSSLYPGIDHLPTRLPTIDRYGHAWCLVCHGRNGRAVAGDGLCDTCRGHGTGPMRRVAYGHGAYPFECRCGQRAVASRADAPRVCGSCLELERAPQGETLRLFEPAPAQIPGQLGF